MVLASDDMGTWEAQGLSDDFYEGVDRHFLSFVICQRSISHSCTEVMYFHYQIRSFVHSLKFLSLAQNYSFLIFKSWVRN
jgi:hypothetical protein